MLQINTQPYASDALEDAMRLAQTKALNSYTFSDCINYLNYAWMDMFHSIVLIDEGYYSITQKLTQKLTRLPPFVKNSVLVYAARDPSGYNRDIYRASGYNDLNDVCTYHVSGFDLYCPDAVRRNVWINYVPMQPQIFFTHHNRDPKLHDTYDKVQSDNYNLYRLTLTPPYMLIHKNASLDMPTTDLTPLISREPDWEIVYISADFPYIFVTYKHRTTGEHLSGFYHNILDVVEFVEYNPFAFTGRNSNVEYLKCNWNDKTGMGVVIRDYNDNGQIKELGWTPDTMLNYPCPEMYRYLVARLADKFSALNESNIMGVQKELVEAEYAFKAFCKKDKSSWQRINNVNGPTIADML